MEHDSISDYRKFEILPNIYLSEFPREPPHDITHILNMCKEAHPVDLSRTYCHIALDDIDNITEHIPTIIKFIDSALQNNGTVLIHCAFGLNRSVAATIAYLCHKKQINSADALKFVKERKADVIPTTLFLAQIDRYFGRQGKPSEDPLVGFHERLARRKCQPFPGVDDV